MSNTVRFKKKRGPKPMIETQFRWVEIGRAFKEHMENDTRQKQKYLAASVVIAAKYQISPGMAEKYYAWYRKHLEYIEDMKERRGGNIFSLGNSSDGVLPEGCSHDK